MGRDIPARICRNHQFYWLMHSRFFAHTLTVHASAEHILKQFCKYHDNGDDPPPMMVDDNGTTIVHFSLGRFANLAQCDIAADAWGWMAIPSGTCTATVYFQTIHQPVTQWVEHVARRHHECRFYLEYQCTTGGMHGTHIVSASDGVDAHTLRGKKDIPPHPLPLIPAMPAAK